MPFLIKLPLFAVFVLLFYVLCLKPLIKGLGQAPPVPPNQPPAPKPAADDDLRLPPRGMTDQERISRLAQSDPERAKDLIRQWLRDEENK
ncbi:MAG: hypothetical protein ACOY3Z_07905 [Thermodesulfobacteriota bacterium]